MELLSLFLVLNLSSSLSFGLGGGGGRSSGGVRIRVGYTVLELFNLRPAVGGLNSDSENLLVAVDKRVNDGRKGREVDGQRHTGDGGNGASEGLKELDIRGERVALVVDLGDSQTVGEGRDVEHVQQGGLGGTDLVTRFNELEIGSDFNGTAGDLGGDTEGLEERGLAGFHTGVASRNPDIGGSDGTSTGRGRNLVRENLVTDGLEIAIGEDEADVAFDVGQNLLVLGGIGNEGLKSSANLNM
ncbi:hypothetical protein RRF57_010150 [Xylaria bambusicola]|uniref:Uncharacterized protein n=1 Tax=Xylaria bambusicola TaxID=326684 RepID=A0AAN7URT8_9PEZI